MDKDLRDWAKIIIETDAKKPITIAEVTADNFEIADGYRVRFTPKYND